MQLHVNPHKLILIGEGEVGKSCLLGALRGDPWEDGATGSAAQSGKRKLGILPVAAGDRTGADFARTGQRFAVARAVV